ncbi:MAG: DEAD/DEAH box helicase [Deltaproteobacteria bacterium]|nr:DEAD/DEAH box helicase [Deltaproteobacteria bacterium]
MTDAPETEGQALPDPPLPSFDTMPLSNDVKQTLAEMGYTHPTPVQHAIYDPAIRGVDLVVQARTGTGKTAAFGIPLIDQIVKRSQLAAQALVLTPTRELALQVSRELTRIGAKRDVRTVAIYGGAPMQRQIDAIREGSQIVVGTPGRTLDHLKRGTLDPRTIRVLVLDESDEMLSMGFERELSAILEFLPKERQTLLFSATLPADIVRIAQTRLREPQFVTLSGDHVGALDVTHYVYFVREDKIGVFLRILEVENPESAVIFCNTKDETERVATALSRAGFEADWLNGDLPQSDREKVMASTREGRLRFLVATDVAARGIDISHLTHVINYDFPDTPEQYVHRTGRTGRMGRTGTAINLIMPQDIGALYILRLTYKIRPFEKQIPTSGELKTRAEADVIQMLADAFASRTLDIDDLALARRLLTHDKAETIIASLLRDHLGERPKAIDEAAAGRRSRAPRPAPAEPRKVEVPGERGRPTRRERAPRERIERLVEEAKLPRKPREDRAEQTAPERAPRRAPPAEPRPARHQERRRDARDDDDLPGYEVTALADAPAIAATPAERKEPPAEPPRAADVPKQVDMANMSHAAFVDWSPPAEANDDEPILEAIGGESIVPPAGDQIAPEDQVEIFVNSGRREGAHAEDFFRVFDGASISREDIARVRLRDRHSFIVVRRAVLDAAIGALNGARIGSKVVSAELAKPKAPPPSMS